MHTDLCHICGDATFDTTTYISLARQDFAATYTMYVCWHCFEIFRTMAHTAAHKINAHAADERVRFPVALSR